MGFLEANGVSYTKAPAEGNGDPSAEAENARKYTVEVQCLK